MTLTGIIPYLYMLAYIVIGWRLYVIPWATGLKALSGAAMVIAPPLLFILPALRNREGNMADLLLATGIGMLVMGILCLLGGVAAAWLRARSRRT
jgi:F0F1-type ATP synthase assembly protein I